jgi:hypothetical protein
MIYIIIGGLQYIISAYRKYNILYGRLCGGEKTNEVKGAISPPRDTTRKKFEYLLTWVKYGKEIACKT